MGNIGHPSRKGVVALSQAILEGVNRIFQKALICQSEAELGRFCLQVAEELTRSPFGFIGLIDPQGKLLDLAISDPGLNACQIDSRNGPASMPTGLPIHGIYGRVLRDGKGLLTNNPSTHPDSIGLPPGHPPLTAFLGAPFLYDDKVVGMVGVANCPDGYRNDDLFTLNALSVAMVQALKHKQVEAALRESEELFLALFESPSVAMSMADPASGRLLNVNKTYTKMLGYTLEDLADRAFTELTHPEDREQDWAGFNRMVRGEIPSYSVEKRIMHKDGHPVWCLVTVNLVRDSTGRPLRSVAVILDISERKHAAFALAEANDALERERDILQAVMNGAKNSHLVYLDRNFNFVRVNQPYAQICGYHPEEMIGKNHFDLYPHTENQAIFTAVRDTGQSVHYRDRPFNFPNAPERGVTYWDWTLSPVKDSTGQVAGLVLSLFETTKQKQTEFDLAAAKQVAEEASRAKSEFLAIMSHEIRTPMTVFMNAIEQLQYIDDNPEHRQLLALAEQSSQRLHVLVNDILDFSKIEARRVDLDMEWFNLRTCLQNTLAMMSARAAEKGLRLELEIAPAVPESLLGDPYRLGQILLNLIGNAIKFTDHGEVRITVTRREASLEFAISDTGIGIPAGQLEKIFETFSQVDSSSTRRHGGTGLGLAISKGLVLLMGGQIDVRSQVGRGTVFVFTLPVPSSVPGQSRGQANDRAMPVVTAPAAQILLVEDNPLVREVILLSLARQPWQTTTAESGRDAVRKWQAGNFDVILMDLQMPDMDGLAATREIRRLEGDRATPVGIIGLTAHVNRGAQQACLEAGMNEVLVKPFETDSLYRAIERQLPH